MDCLNEDVTDADNPAVFRMSIFFGNNSFHFEKNMRNFKEI